ncbi:HepT-like ribonuclease domain-containing protein [Sulfurimonas sp.]|uniref:HepT-like ribonuclease domain-containing protein n=1 Tax=Sulfurimonas sp. TaxID=2022749 RepID=UPI002636951B|nr:HepT-like ribonuclease domain-containing protein [Sulfurimonas sp.]MDD3854971.1 DUF86 domain-containing protein [Sulfurimonas sp.]
MSSPQQRLKNIKNSIDDIEFILNSVEFKISQAIEDKILKPAIRMHIIKIAEQFNKLKDDNVFDVLEKFSSNDLKGISAVRNFIAHDYDSVDDSIIEDVLRINMPIIKAVVVKELGLS